MKPVSSTTDNTCLIDYLLFLGRYSLNLDYALLLFSARALLELPIIFLSSRYAWAVDYSYQHPLYLAFDYNP